MKITSSIFRILRNLWPPFLFSGIKITEGSHDFRHVKVKLKLRFWNCNYVGTQYGGSLYSMVDAFYMVMLIKNLGPDYIVWDKAATIRFLKPGRTDVTTEFHLSEEDLASIRAIVQEQGKMDWYRTVEIKDKNGVVVTVVDKTVYIKKRTEGGKPALNKKAEQDVQDKTGYTG